VSSDFGNEDARRHVTFGFDCAMAGAASAAVAAAAPRPAVPAFLMNERRSMKNLPVWIKKMPDPRETLDFLGPASGADNTHGKAQVQHRRGSGTPAKAA
jgi:hypothetical protein